MTIEQKLDQIIKNQEELSETLEEQGDTLLRIEESIANISTPGGNYGVERYPDFEE